MKAFVLLAAVVRGVRDGMKARAKPQSRESIAAVDGLAHCKLCGPTYEQVGLDGHCNACWLATREARAIYRTLTR